MTRRLGTLTAILALTAIAASCGSDSKSSSTTAAVATTAAPASTAAPTTTAAAATTASAELSSAASVDIKQFKFGPAEVHVAVGGTVTWTNSDNQKHTATESGGFDAGTIEPGATGTATFDTAGSFAYICSFHPFMKGTVVVGS
jgi:plastocyanin